MKYAVKSPPPPRDRCPVLRLADLAVDVRETPGHERSIRPSGPRPPDGLHPQRFIVTTSHDLAPSRTSLAPKPLSPNKTVWSSRVSRASAHRCCFGSRWRTRGFPAVLSRPEIRARTRLESLERGLRSIARQSLPQPCLVSPVGATKKALMQGFLMGGTGLEPVTPSLSSWCSPN
jgi:hypothetical protein